MANKLSKNEHDRIEFETIIAHRGESIVCPENTLPSYQYAFELGADGLECDLQITKDNVPVLFHDRTLREKTGEDITISSLSYNELLQRDVGIWKGPEWRGTRIPTLEQLLEVLPSHKMLHLEFKCGTNAVELVEKLVSQVKRILKQIIFTSFSYDIATKCKKTFPDTPFLINGMVFDFDRILAIGAQGIAIWYDHELVKKAQSMNMMMRVGDMNSYEAVEKAYKDRVRCIDTDNLEMILEISYRI